MRLASLSTSGSNPSFSQSKIGCKSLLSCCNFGKSSPCGVQKSINSFSALSIALDEIGLLEEASVFGIGSSFLGFTDKICGRFVCCDERNLMLPVDSKLSGSICAMKLSFCNSLSASKFNGVS